MDTLTVVVSGCAQEALPNQQTAREARFPLGPNNHLLSQTTDSVASPHSHRQHPLEELELP